MISLTYLSTATARDGFSPDELTDLLVTSRRNNHAAGLSGMLLYVNGHFIQTLEGPQDAVEQTFARIGRDPRHRDVLLVLRDETPTRVFAEWTMGFESVDPEEAASIPGFDDYLRTRTVPPEAARELGRAGVFHRAFRERMH